MFSMNEKFRGNGTANPGAYGRPSHFANRAQTATCLRGVRDRKCGRTQVECKHWQV